jgi:hypothetical protein
MRVGLIGSQSSPDLGALKREIEDRGHNAVFINLRKFPQYAMSMLGRSSGAPPMGSGLSFDHIDLLDFACFYLHDFEGRDRFFRGSFGEDIWAALRERYLDYAGCEVDNLAFQMSLVRCLADERPMINTPRSLWASRLRPYIYFKLTRAGIPVPPYAITTRGFEEDASLPRDASLAKRIRIAEDYSYDVPCFPRDLENTLAFEIAKPNRHWRLLAIRECEPSKMIGVEDASTRSAAVPNEATEVAKRVLHALDLELAELHISADANSFAVFDVLPCPRVSEFEEVTGEKLSGSVADRLLWLGGSK